MVFRQADNQIKRRGMLFDGAAKGSKGRRGVPSKAGHDERPSENCFRRPFDDFLA